MTIEIYNAFGRKIETLIRESMTGEAHEVGLKNLAASCEEPSLRARQPIFDPEIIPKVLAYPEVELRGTVAKRSSTESMRERDSTRIAAGGSHQVVKMMVSK